MNLKAFKRPLLLELAKRLGLEVRELIRKPKIIEAIENLEADDDELSECLELIEEEKNQRCIAEERNEKLKREAEEENEKRIAEEKEREDKRFEMKLQMKLRELELLKARIRGGSKVSSGVERKPFNVEDLMQPCRSGEDIGRYLVNFEQTCEKAGVTKRLWPRCLLILLPYEAADIIARLSKEESDDYEQVRSSLLMRLNDPQFEAKQQSGSASVDVEHERCGVVASAVTFRASEKASARSSSSVFMREESSSASEHDALAVEAVQGQMERDGVMCQWDVDELAHASLGSVAEARADAGDSSSALASEIRLSAVNNPRVCEGKSALASVRGLSAVNNARVVVEAVQGQSERGKVMCQWNVCESARPAVVDLAHSSLGSVAEARADAGDGSSTLTREMKVTAINAEVVVEAVHGQSERDEVSCQSDEREASRQAPDDLARIHRECIAKVDLACEVRDYVGSLDDKASACLGECAEARCRECDAGADSAQICELRSSDSPNCIVPKCARLSASQEGNRKDQLPVNNLDCVSRSASENSEISQAEEMRVKGSKRSSKRRSRRKKRHRERNAAGSAGRLTSDFKRGGKSASKVRFSRVENWAKTRASRRAKRERKAHYDRTRSEGHVSSRGHVPLSYRRFLHGKLSREFRVRPLREAVEQCHGGKTLAAVVALRSEANTCVILRASCLTKTFSARPPRVRLKRARQT